MSPVTDCEESGKIISACCVCHFQYRVGSACQHIHVHESCWDGCAALFDAVGTADQPARQQLLLLLENMLVDWFGGCQQ
jgi:hypothetical protein